MKYLSKALLMALSTACLEVYARDIIVLENMADKSSGDLVIKILEEKFNIPRQLIAYRNSECSKSSEAILQLCMRANGELDIVKVDRFVMKNSFGVFFGNGASL
jgi:hypothetical protein